MRLWVWGAREFSPHAHKQGWVGRGRGDCGDAAPRISFASRRATVPSCRGMECPARGNPSLRRLVCIYGSFPFVSATENPKAILLRANLDVGRAASTSGTHSCLLLPLVYSVATPMFCLLLRHPAATLITCRHSYLLSLLLYSVATLIFRCYSYLSMATLIFCRYSYPLLLLLLSVATMSCSPGRAGGWAGGRADGRAGGRVGGRAGNRRSNRRADGRAVNRRADGRAVNRRLYYEKLSMQLVCHGNISTTS